MPRECTTTEVLNASERGDGSHRVLKMVHEGTPLVLKCYGLKRSLVRTLIREFGSVVLVGKSSILPAARCRTERETIELWHGEGFDVPELLPHKPVLDPPQPCLAMEFVPGKTLGQTLRLKEIDLKEKIALIRKFARITGERHARAQALKEPRLLYEHPALEHVLLHEDRMVHFDFEIVFTRRHKARNLAKREIAGFLNALGKVEAAIFPPIVEALVDAYPDKKLLAEVAEDLERYGSVPVAGWAWLQSLSGKFGRHARRSTYAEPLRKALERHRSSSLERHESSSPEKEER